MEDKNQSKRFIDKARELGADESGRIFERAFKKVVSPLIPRKQRKKLSDEGCNHGNTDK